MQTRSLRWVQDPMNRYEIHKSTDKKVYITPTLWIGQVRHKRTDFSMQAVKDIKEWPNRLIMKESLGPESILCETEQGAERKFYLPYLLSYYE